LALTQEDNMSNLGRILRIAITALALVASTQAFARGEGGGGGGGGGDSGAGEHSAIVPIDRPTPDKPPVLSPPAQSRNLPAPAVRQPNNNCTLRMRQMRYC
jgi:hypothetical protein